MAGFMGSGPRWRHAAVCIAGKSMRGAGGQWAELLPGDFLSKRRVERGWDDLTARSLAEAPSARVSRSPSTASRHGPRRCYVEKGISPLRSSSPSP